MSKRIKASDYTHSVWSGKKYDKPQTVESLTKESLAVLKAHSAISRNASTRDQWLAEYARKNGLIVE